MSTSCALRSFIFEISSGKNLQILSVRTLVNLFTKEVVPKHSKGKDE